MTFDWKLEIQSDLNRIDYALYIYRDIDHQKREFITKGGLEVETQDKTSSIDKDVTFARILPEQLQQLQDEIAQLGVQPKSNSVNEGKLIATEKHLDDMRKLVFKRKK